MKRSFAFFALVCAILFGCVATAGAQSKALKKDVKKRVKELKKEGWKPLASSSTLEYAFSKYRTYLEEDSENRIELVGIAIGKNVKQGECHNEWYYQLCFPGKGTGGRQNEDLAFLFGNRCSGRRD